MTTTQFLATGIGSMPFSDPDSAVQQALAHYPSAPFWPQLPRVDLHEQMEIQYSEGMPRIVVDRDHQRMYFDTSGDYSEQFAEFYEAYMAAMDPDDGNGDCSALAISSEFARGLYAFEAKLKAHNGKLAFLKVQTTGPLSFALSIVDENKRASYYNEEFRDVVVKALAMKCRWQIQRFQRFAHKVMCFIDEPILSAFGSSTYVSVKRQDVVSMLSEVVAAVHADGALAGIHCCGNTEWAIPIDAGADIVSFDAFEFGQTIAMYPEAVASLFKRGGLLAWGIVPTSLAIREQSVEALAGRLESLFDHLASKGIDRQLIAERAVLTGACGTGSMDPSDAQKVFRLTGELSKAMKQRYGLIS